MKKKVTRLILMILCAVALTVAISTTTAQAAEGKIKLVYVEWDSEIASTNVVAAILEDTLGYEVEMTPVSAAAMWQAMGTGDQDAMVAAWLDTTHAHYLDKVKDKVENLGPNLVGTRIGLVVPAYVTINSIAEMNEHAKKFDGEIIGIDPGAGLMSKTEKVIEEYKLTNIELVSGSDAIMTAALKNAIRKKDWIAVTGWTPHWKFGRWELKYLEDPKNVYGGEEHIDTIVRKGLKEDMPKAYKFLDAFHWAPKDMATVMVWNQEKGADPAKTARRWIKENPDKVATWLK